MLLQLPCTVHVEGPGLISPPAHPAPLLDSPPCLCDKFFGNKSDDKVKIVELLDKICKDQLEPFIEKSYQELASYVSAYEQKMIMKRENIADRGIWTAKKRYILNVWDSEGVRYKEPKMKPAWTRKKPSALAAHVRA